MEGRNKRAINYDDDGPGKRHQGDEHGHLSRGRVAESRSLSPQGDWLNGAKRVFYLYRLKLGLMEDEWSCLILLIVVHDRASCLKLCNCVNFPFLSQ